MTSLQTGQTEMVATLRQKSLLVAMAACRHPTPMATAVHIHHCWQPGQRCPPAAAVVVVDIHPWRCPTTAVLAEIHG